MADLLDSEPSTTSWEYALTKHMSRLSPEQAVQFQESMNIREFLDKVSKIIGAPEAQEPFGYRYREGDKRYRIWNILNKSLRPLKRFGSVIDVAVQANSMIGCSIWAPLKLVVQICCEHIDLVDYLGLVLSTIGQNIDRITCYENVFGKNEMVQASLGFLYADYLDFCTRLVQYNKKRAVSRVFTSFGEDFQSVCTAMKEHEQRFDFTAIAAYIAEDTAARRQEVEDRKRALFREILQWIGGPSDFDVDLRKMRAQRQDGSCDWFQRLGKYRGWVNSRYHTHAILWVYGAPGCGKSVLASSIIDHLKEATDKPILYFFCKNDNVDKNSSLAVLRSLIAQLLLWAPGLLTHIEGSFQKSGKRQIDSFYALLPIFLTCLANARSEYAAVNGADGDDKSTGYIVIDGVDECDESAISDLCSATKLWTEARPTTIFPILFTSRYTQCINDGFAQALPKETCEYWDPDYLAYQMSTTDTQRYIPTFIKAGVERSTTLKAAEAAGLDVSEAIIKASAGHWLYARLALEDAKRQPTLRCLKKSLQNLPDNLSKLYSQILVEHQVRFEGDELRMAKVIFEWVCIARIPRPLSVEEISTILSIKDEQSHMNPDDIPLDCTGLIQRLCGPLLEIDDLQRVHVTHQSVKEYFLKAAQAKRATTREELPLVVGNLYETSMSLACTSLSFVLLEDVQKFFNENSAQTPSYERIDEKFPLLQQVLLPIWDWYGNYAFQAGRAYLEGLVSLEHHMKSITRLAQFLTSPKNLPWITATLHTYGQHDLSVLFTRIGLCVALSKDVDISGDNLAIWRVLFPDSIDFWLSEFYTLAKRLKWRFRFYEVVRNGEIFSNETTVSETGDDGLLGPYSLEILSTLENWSFPEYGYYDDYGIHFSGHEENDEKVSEVIDKALESHVSNAMSEGNGGIAPSGSESDEADAFAHRLRPDLKNAETSQTYVRARQLFRDGEWDLWWFSYKTGKIYQRLGRCRGFPG